MRGERLVERNCSGRGDEKLQRREHGTSSLCKMYYLCRGCHNTFSRQAGFLQHLRKTQSTKCIEVRQTLEEQMGRRPSRSDLPRARPRRPRHQRRSSPTNTKSESDSEFKDDYPSTDYGEADFAYPTASEVDINEVHEQPEAEEPVPDLSEVGNTQISIDDMEASEDDGPEHGAAWAADDERDIAGSEGVDLMDIDEQVEGRVDSPHPPESFNQAEGGGHSQPGSGSEDPPQQAIHIDRFGGRAGEVTARPDESTGVQSAYLDDRNRLDGYDGRDGCRNPNEWVPFKSRIDWEVACWAKLRGPGSTAFSELIAIPGVRENLDLSYKNGNELNKLIDSLPSPRPAFEHHEVEVAGEMFDLYARDILECVRALYGDPEHAQYLSFAPERHYVDADRVERVYHEMHTGKWWWNTQVELEKNKPGATIIPVILSSDKTQLTLFGNKTAYPVYLTIGNLPKSVRCKPSRQAQILLAYLPTTRLEHITNKAARRRTLANLFHACIGHILSPLREAGVDGIDIVSGDGLHRRGHPILAAYVGDYPEHCMVTGAYSGDCPICDCPHEELGMHPCDASLRDLDAIFQVLGQLGSPSYSAACRDVRIKPLQQPFWADLPYVNIFRSITPDILHQLYQGVVKHLVSWLTTICGATEIDARVRRFPPNHSIRLFRKGITSLTRVTGTEHKQIAALLLGLIIDIRLPQGVSTAPLLTATRALLDFLYLAQYPVHTDKTLQDLQTALDNFHDNAFIFLDLGIRSHLNIPKFHSLQHYVVAIKRFGTTDNYNTEFTERLHIDFTKDAYRATNHKEELGQMTSWLERKEKVLRHVNYLRWRSQQMSRAPLPQISARQEDQWRTPDLAQPLKLKMALHPTRNSVSLDDISSPLHYDAPLFCLALTRFVAQFNNPTVSRRRQLDEHARSIHLPFISLPVFHRIKFLNPQLEHNTVADLIHAQPPLYDDANNITNPARFDVALVNVRNIRSHSKQTHDFRVGQVKVIFTIPPKAAQMLFYLGRQPPKYLAYVEWFTNFGPEPDPTTKLYRVRRATQSHESLASVIPVELIARSVHLLPKWGGNVLPDWSSDNVLKLCPSFFVNPFKDMPTYFNFN